MKDLNNLSGLLEITAAGTEDLVLRMFFYDPDKIKKEDIKKIKPYDSDKFVVSANHFLEYTDGSPEENAKINERFPELMSFLRGEVVEIGECIWNCNVALTAPLRLGASFSYTDLINTYKIKVFAGHDAWSMGNDSNAYKLQIQFDNAQQFHVGRDPFYKIEGLRIKLEYPEVPKRCDRLYASPVRFDEFSSFKDLKWLLLAMSMWPKNILLFSAVTRYFKETPVVSTVVYRPEFHTMREVFIRLFSKTKKGFTSSLFDVCKVLDIMERHDSNATSEEKYTGYGSIGGLDKATVKAYLGLRTFCRLKVIKDFKESLDKEIVIAKEFCKKLDRLSEECGKILTENPEADLRDLSKKLIGDLYDDVIVDPVSFASMYVKQDQWESRDLMITQVLSNMCMTSDAEEELLNDNPQGDNNNVNRTTTGTGSGSTGESPEEVLRIQDNSGETAP